MEEELQGQSQETQETPQGVAQEETQEEVETFDIILYLEGLTGFVFDKTVLERVARDRGVDKVETFEELTSEQKGLCKADLLYTAYCSPDVWASQTHAHGSFSQTTGSQTLQQKQRILDMAIALYKKWGDEEMLEEIQGVGGDLQWLDM